MKKSVLTLLLSAIILASSIVGCTINKANPEETMDSTTELECLVKKGKLLCGTEVGYYPMEFYDDSGTAVGLDIDVANEVGKRLGLEVEIIDTAWEGIFSGLDTRRYDIIFGVTVTPERAKEMSFSNTYIESWQSIVTKKGSIDISSIQDIAGLKVGYLGGATSDEILNDLIASGTVNCQTFSYEKVIYAFDDLKFGRIDAVFCDSIVADGYIEKDNDFVIAWSQKDDGTIEAEKIGAAIRLNNTELLEAVNNVLNDMENDGTLDRIRKEWLC